MSKELEFKPWAKKEIDKAYFYYKSNHSDLGLYFIEELNNCLDKIIHHPKMYVVISKYYRQARLKRFPYYVIFETTKNKIVVYGLFHSSRNPTKKVASKKSGFADEKKK